MSSEELQQELKELRERKNSTNLTLSNIASLMMIGLPTTIKSIELNNETIQVLGIASSLILGTATGIIINKVQENKDNVKRKYKNDNR